MKRNIKGDWGLYCLLATVGACCILTVLKLYGLIAISWKYVFAPVWVPMVSAFLLVIVFYCILNNYKKLWRGICQ